MEPISISNCRIKRIRYEVEQAYGIDEIEENSNMDERIWSKFPEDLMIRVISFLPISVVLRSTLLCKSWKSIISSSFFLKLINSEIPNNSHRPWFMIFHREFSGLCFAYDPSLNKWVDLSFCFLPSLLRPIAAGDGLVCLLYKTQSGFNLYISNPISKSHKRITTPTSLFRYFFVVSGLLFDKINDYFRLILVGSEQILNGSEQFILSAEVYNSEIGLWTRHRSFPVDNPISSCRTISNGVLYCVLGRSTFSAPISIVAFDIKLKVWFMLEVPLPRSLTVIRLMDHKDRLVMICGIGMHGITEEIGIWQLDNSGKELEMIGWISKQFCDFFLRSLRKQFTCTGHGDLIYFTSKGCPYVVMYNISLKHLKLLEPPARVQDPHYHCSSGFCFKPRF